MSLALDFGFCLKEDIYLYPLSNYNCFLKFVLSSIVDLTDVEYF